MTDCLSILNCIKNISSMLCDKEDLVNVEYIETSDNNFVFLISADKSDMPKLIGSKGKNFNAIKTIVYAASAKLKVRSSVVIRE